MSQTQKNLHTLSIIAKAFDAEDAFFTLANKNDDGTDKHLGDVASFVVAVPLIEAKLGDKDMQQAVEGLSVDYRARVAEAILDGTIQLTTQNTTAFVEGLQEFFLENGEIPGGATLATPPEAKEFYSALVLDTDPTMLYAAAPEDVAEAVDAVASEEEQAPGNTEEEVLIDQTPAEAPNETPAETPTSEVPVEEEAVETPAEEAPTTESENGLVTATTTSGIELREAQVDLALQTVAKLTQAVGDAAQTNLVQARTLELMVKNSAGSQKTATVEDAVVESAAVPAATEV